LGIRPIPYKITEDQIFLANQKKYGYQVSFKLVIKRSGKKTIIVTPARV
jgi:hypothetical protein